MSSSHSSFFTLVAHIFTRQLSTLDTHARSPLRDVSRNNKSVALFCGESTLSGSRRAKITTVANEKKSEPVPTNEQVWMSTFAQIISGFIKWMFPPSSLFPLTKKAKNKILINILHEVRHRAARKDAIAVQGQHRHAFEENSPWNIEWIFGKQPSSHLERRWLRTNPVGPSKSFQCQGEKNNSSPESCCHRDLFRKHNLQNGDQDETRRDRQIDS